MGKVVNTQERDKLFASQQAKIRYLLVQAFILLKKRKSNAAELDKEFKLQSDLGAFKNDASFDGEHETYKLYHKVVHKLGQDKNVYSYSDLDTDIQTFKKIEESNLEELKAKRILNRVGIFFAALMGLACGTMIGGSLFMAAHNLGWTGNVVAFSILAISSVASVAIVTVANWWITKRLVSELQFKQNRWWERLKPKTRFVWLNEILWPFYFVCIALPGFMINYLFFFYNKSDSEQIRGTSLKEDAKVLFWRIMAFAAALIYAFFAYAATVELGASLAEFAIEEFGVGEGLRGATKIPSMIIAGILGFGMFPTMKAVFGANGETWARSLRHPLRIIDTIPKAKQNNLRLKFFGFAFLIALGFVFAAVAAIDPLVELLTSPDSEGVPRGMKHGPASILSWFLVTFASIGNAPFYINSTAESMKQHYDPQPHHASNNNKYFGFVRFWNGFLNALPSIVGMLAVMGGWLTGHEALLGFAVIVLGATFVSSAAGSYAGNHGGAPEIHDLEPDITEAEDNIRELGKLLENNQAVTYDAPISETLDEDDADECTSKPLLSAYQMPGEIIAKIDSYLDDGSSSNLSLNDAARVLRKVLTEQESSHLTPEHVQLLRNSKLSSLLDRALSLPYVRHTYFEGKQGMALR